MPHFIVRVELHEHLTHPFIKPDYSRLHIQMKEANFVRYVLYNNVKLELPPAEYMISASLTIDQVIEKAHAIVNTLGFRPSIMVIQIADIRVWGLDPFRS